MILCLLFLSCISTTFLIYFTKDANNDGGDNSEDDEYSFNEETNKIASGSDGAKFVFTILLTGEVAEEGVMCPSCHRNYTNCSYDLKKSPQDYNSNK